MNASFYESTIELKQRVWFHKNEFCQNLQEFYQWYARNNYFFPTLWWGMFWFCGRIFLLYFFFFVVSFFFLIFFPLILLCFLFCVFLFFLEDPKKQRFVRLKLQYQVPAFPPEFSRSSAHIPGWKYNQRLGYLIESKTHFLSVWFWLSVFILCHPCLLLLSFFLKLISFKQTKL